MSTNKRFQSLRIDSLQFITDRTMNIQMNAFIHTICIGTTFTKQNIEL